MDFQTLVPRDLRKWLKARYGNVDCLAVWYDVEECPARIEFHASAFVNGCTYVILYGVWLPTKSTHILFNQEIGTQCDIFDLL